MREVLCCGKVIEPVECSWCQRPMSPIKIRDLMVVQDWITAYGKYRYQSFKSGVLRVCSNCIERLNTIILRCDHCPHTPIGAPHVDLCEMRNRCDKGRKDGC